MIPSSDRFDQSTLCALLECDAVVQAYCAFFALLDWQVVEQGQQQRSVRGRPGHPVSAYLKAFLIGIREGFPYTTQLRRFLVKHPLLVIELGFQLVLDPRAPYGFDVEQTLPCDYWLREQLRRLDQGLLQALLHATVAALQEEIPGLGEMVAFDYWYIYETVAQHEGIAAIPLNTHGHEEVPRDSDGTLRCAAGLRMHPTYQFQHTNGYRAQRFRCPLLFPQPTGQTCEHAQFAKGKGCVKDPNWEKGGLMRALLDRDGPLYHVIYTQRTCCERINSQAQALGIERPKVRNSDSVRNLNTLIYLIINVCAL